MSEDLLRAFKGEKKDQERIDLNRLNEVSEMVLGKLSDDEKNDFEMMLGLALRGITPEEYEQFYHIFQMSGSLVNDMFGDESEDINPFIGGNLGKRGYDVKEYEPLQDASERTLVLKIQMKDVSKPPMWREVEVPGDFFFSQLHEVIQEVTGLEDCHLWQFNVKAYDDSLQIGTMMDEEFGRGLDYVTDDADATPLTRFLQNKGDKLEYVYDFGDDWIFKVEVLSLENRKIEHPVCRKFKSELNAIEDFGGIWSYIAAREDMAGWGKMSKKEKKKRLNETGFDSEDEYLEFLYSNMFNIDEVNDFLRMI